MELRALVRSDLRRHQASLMSSSSHGPAAAHGQKGLARFFRVPATCHVQCVCVCVRECGWVGGSVLALV
jgi:hypothetical protein